MLQKRTNILFDQEIWNKLTLLAKRENTSVGDLTRKAVQKTYFENDVDERRRKAHDLILKIRPISKGKINYKELINAGRKY